MRTTAAAVLIVSCMLPEAVLAVDWSIHSTQSETIEYSDNLFLSPKPIGGTLASFSTISANAEARTPTSKFDFDSFANYNKYWGPGADALPTTETLAFGFKGHYETIGKNPFDRTFLEGGFHQQSAAFALLGELGVVTPVTGAIDTVNVGGGLDRSLSARDSVSLSANSTRTSYEPSSAGIAFTDTSATGSWSHHLSPLTTAVVSSNAERVDFQNAFGTNVLILRNQAGFDTSISPLLSFHGMWGVANVETDNTGVGTGSASSAGFITDMLLTYKALKDTTFTLAGSQKIGPTVVGSLVKTSSVRASMIHLINSYSTLTVSADAFENTSTSTSQFASASVSYSRTFARNWTASLTYRFLHSFGSSGGTAGVPVIAGTPVIAGFGPANSNSIFVVVSKSTTVLPHAE